MFHLSSCMFHIVHHLVLGLKCPFVEPGAVVKSVGLLLCLQRTGYTDVQSVGLGILIVMLLLG